MKRPLPLAISTLTLLALAGCGGDAATTPVAGQPAAPAPATPQAPQVDDDDIAGSVYGPNGPEAGVWVIAETRDLATLYSKTVVTDENGLFVIPDLPLATYEVFVRGYGLVDSPRQSTAPGVSLDLRAIPAPNAAAAAQYYPAGYWYSLLEVPEAHEFPGTGQDGNGIAEGILNQDDFIRRVSNGGCVVCHQMGSEATRTTPSCSARSCATSNAS